MQFIMLLCKGHHQFYLELVSIMSPQIVFNQIHLPLFNETHNNKLHYVLLI